MAGVRHRLDLFGVLVLSFAAAGGITHDLLIGAVPPASIADWRYIVVPGWLAGDVLGPSVGPAVAEPRARFRCCRVGAVRCCRRAQGARLPTQPSRGDDARGCDRRRRGWSGTCCGGSPQHVHAELYAVAVLAAVGGQLLQLPSDPLATIGAGNASGCASWPSGVAGDCRWPERPSDQAVRTRRGLHVMRRAALSGGMCQRCHPRPRARRVEDGARRV
jgi:glycine transporter